MSAPAGVHVVELEGLGSEQWRALIAGEHQPWGGVAEHMSWREKTRHAGVRDEQERLLAAGGVVQAQVRVGEHEPFAVAGIGGIIVTRACRGRGLARLVIERVLEIAATLGPERAMLFCLPRNVALYEKFGFRLLAGPVRARQPEGTIELPMSAMWRPLRDGAGWPRGAVEVLGEPF